MPSIMNTHQQEAVAVADAHAHNVGLPLYSQALALLSRLASPDQGETLLLEDYRQIARKLMANATFDGDMLKSVADAA